MSTPDIFNQFFDVHSHIHDHPEHLEVFNMKTKWNCPMGTRPSDWELVHEAAMKNPNRVIPGFGVHPWYAHEVAENDQWKDTLKEYLEKHEKAVLGEIGLDKIATNPVSKERYDLPTQLEIFKYQFSLAASLNRVVSVHCVQAHGYLLEYLRQLKPDQFPPKIMLHSYSGSHEIIKAVLKLPKKVGSRFYFSFSKLVNLRTKKLTDNILMIPKNRILIESDANTLEMVDQVMEDICIALGEIWGCENTEVAEITFKNSLEFFGLEE
ncbi:Cut9-interacting protein scn1 [Basidiobolus ranarum]|uniref:Cut9-interacting protein scn1 n=1 Tax=Basidiobolus ranarum TaxID=34480 RepID=A0ABR2W387_9FUNG